MAWLAWGKIQIKKRIDLQAGKVCDLAVGKRDLPVAVLFELPEGVCQRVVAIPAQ